MYAALDAAGAMGHRNHGTLRTGGLASIKHDDAAASSGNDTGVRRVHRTRHGRVVYIAARDAGTRGGRSRTHAAQRRPLVGILGGHEHLHRADVLGTRRGDEAEGLVQYVALPGFEGGHRIVDVGVRPA